MKILLFALVTAIFLFAMPILSRLAKTPLDMLKAAWMKMPNGPKLLLTAGAIFIVCLMMYWGGVSLVRQEQDEDLAWMRIYRGCPQDSILTILGPPASVHGSAGYEVWHYGWLSNSYVAFDSERRVVYWRQ